MLHWEGKGRVQIISIETVDCWLNGLKLEVGGNNLEREELYEGWNLICLNWNSELLVKWAEMKMVLHLEKGGVRRFVCIFFNETIGTIVSNL